MGYIYKSILVYLAGPGFKPRINGLGSGRASNYAIWLGDKFTLCFSLLFENCLYTNQSSLVHAYSLNCSISLLDFQFSSKWMYLVLSSFTYVNILEIFLKVRHFLISS